MTEGAAPAEPAAPPHGWRRWQKTILAFAVAVVVLGAAVLFLLYGGEKPTSTSSDEALQRYRSGTVPATAPAAGPGTTAAPAGPRPPAPGLYRYTGQGTEVTSFPPLTEAQGPDMPGTVSVEPDGGCWTFRIDYNTHHWQDWTWCPLDGGTGNTIGHSFARRDLGGAKIDNLATFSCLPPAPWSWPGMQPGDRREQACTGSSTLVPATTTSTGSLTYVGDEDVTVGSSTVRARRLRYERTLAGGQVGTERADWWVVPDTGLPLRNERQLAVDTDTPFGSIHYTEQASFALQALTPTT